ncbi:hypothetical protein SDC9_90638 [bioreactor metagenome]|uniref:DUF4097 domain-containing protein n=1 Tax=bioreactor metagenome TaxID=1076179 RepID=A0A644ZSL6_9ZZZZ
MNRNLKIIRIAMWSLVALGLTAILILGITNSNGINGVFNLTNIIDSNIAVQKDEKLEIKSVNKIIVDFSSSNIIVKVTDEDNMRIVQKSSKTLKDDEKFQVIQGNNQITIEKRNFGNLSNTLSFGNFKEVIEIYLPKKYNSDLDIETSSGDINFDSDIILSNANFSASSGDIVSKYNLQVKDFNIETSSGDISIETLTAPTYKIKATSGDIKINSLTGSGKVDTSSGDIKIEYKDIEEYLEVTATSGDVKLTIQKGISFEFKGKCSSGDINSNLDLNYKDENHHEATAKIGNGPYKKITANTSSGDISISN